MNFVYKKLNIFEAVNKWYYEKFRTESAYCFLDGGVNLDILTHIVSAEEGS